MLLIWLVALHKKGGIYMDTDLLLMKPIETKALLQPSLGVEFESDNAHGAGIRINNAFMGFPTPGHPFLEAVMVALQPVYDPKEWAAIGPDLITQGYKSMTDEVKADFVLLPPKALYPLHWARAHCILRPDRSMLDGDWPVHLRNQSTGVHLYNSNSYNHYDGS